MTGTEMTRERRRIVRRIRQTVALRRLQRAVLDERALVADDATALTDA